ncbi:hypothetical protein KFK09_014389 [Dendrobium nobile]|uniref:Uncharacterized protein n=1 Tax=Dendrobium nobile TaxID=94219 RepID=A0A8T3B378_DENNO|nr:hypothetical protein KFK09_014389 [Dendrobium nobile]
MPAPLVCCRSELSHLFLMFHQTTACDEGNWIGGERKCQQRWNWQDNEEAVRYRILMAIVDNQTGSKHLECITFTLHCISFSGNQTTPKSGFTAKRAKQSLFPNPLSKQPLLSPFFY